MKPEFPKDRKEKTGYELIIFLSLAVALIVGTLSIMIAKNEEKNSNLIEVRTNNPVDYIMKGYSVGYRDASSKEGFFNIDEFERDSLEIRQVLENSLK